MCGSQDYVFTGSQNYGIAEVGKNLQVHLVQTLLRHRHSEQSTQACFQAALKISKEEMSQSVWEACASFVIFPITCLNCV